MYFNDYFLAFHFLVYSKMAVLNLEVKNFYLQITSDILEGFFSHVMVQSYNNEKIKNENY